MCPSTNISPCFPLPSSQITYLGCDRMRGAAAPATDGAGPQDLDALIGADLNANL